MGSIPVYKVMLTRSGVFLPDTYHSWRAAKSAGKELAEQFVVYLGNDPFGTWDPLHGWLRLP